MISPYERLERLADEWLRKLVEPSHDAEHVRRVLRMSVHLGRYHGADLEILKPAALLHDLGRAVEGSGRPHADLSIEIADDLLRRCDYSEAEIEAILHCIRAHSFSHGVPPSALEAHLLRDADRLDALGAIGIARTFSFGAEFYDPSDPLGRDKPEPQGDRYCVEHFYEKLFKLPDGLHSPEARRIARERVDFMHEFLRRLEREARGSA